MNSLSRIAQVATKPVQVESDIVNVPLKEITFDKDVQSRDGMNAATVADYSAYFQERKSYGSFPPVDLYDDGKTKWIGDGNHRFEAALLAGLPAIPARVKKGTRRDAILHATAANDDHGLRRSNSDKDRSVRTLLKDDEWRSWSDRQIADHCKVSHTKVSATRSKMESKGEIPVVEKRTTVRNGVTHSVDTENIGKKSDDASVKDLQMDGPAGIAESPTGDSPSPVAPAQPAEPVAPPAADEEKPSIGANAPIETRVEDSGQMAFAPAGDPVPVSAPEVLTQGEQGASVATEAAAVNAAMAGLPESAEQPGEVEPAQVADPAPEIPPVDAVAPVSLPDEGSMPVAEAYKTRLTTFIDTHHFYCAQGTVTGMERISDTSEYILYIDVSGQIVSQGDELLAYKLSGTAQEKAAADQISDETIRRQIEDFAAAYKKLKDIEPQLKEYVERANESVINSKLYELLWGNFNL